MVTLSLTAKPPHHAGAARTELCVAQWPPETELQAAPREGGILAVCIRVGLGSPEGDQIKHTFVF